MLFAPFSILVEGSHDDHHHITTSSFLYSFYAYVHDLLHEFSILETFSRTARLAPARGAVR